MRGRGYDAALVRVFYKTLYVIVLLQIGKTFELYSVVGKVYAYYAHFLARCRSRLKIFKCIVKIFIRLHSHNDVVIIVINILHNRHKVIARVSDRVALSARIGEYAACKNVVRFRFGFVKPLSEVPFARFSERTSARHGIHAERFARRIVLYRRVSL